MRASFSRPLALRLLPAVCLVAAGCGVEARSPAPDSAVARQAGQTSWDPAAWRPPASSEIPDDSLGASIRRGLALMKHTADSLRPFVGGNLSCTSCHLDEGRRANAAPFTGVYARFPAFLIRSGTVASIEDRINYCFTRSLAGAVLPSDSREMRDMVAYLAFLSRGVPVGASTAVRGMPKMPPLTGDTVRGRAVYAEECARCHGADGAGVAAVPALWGPRSYSIGASMARQERAASFIRHNMPFDRPGTLTDQQAFDVAAFVVSHPRPDSPGKELDWPMGGAPADVPYDTEGHAAHDPPPLLPRRIVHGAIVPAPAPARARGR